MPRVVPAADLVHRLAAIELEETSGERIALGRLWDQRPVLLIHRRPRVLPGDRHRAALARRRALALLAGGQPAAARQGEAAGSRRQDPTTLGATHVIHPDGSVPYAWVNASLEDEAPIAEVLAAIQPARPGGS